MNLMWVCYSIPFILFILSNRSREPRADSREPPYSTRAWNASTTGSRSAMRAMT